MKFLNRPGFKLFAAILFGIGVAAILHAATYDLWTLTGTGARRNTVEFRIQAPDTDGTNGASLLPGTDNINAIGSSSLALSAVYTYDLNVSDDLTVTDDFIRGSLTTAVSTTNTSGSGLGTIFTAYLKDGGAGVGTIAAVEGSVLCSTTASALAGNNVTVVVCPATGDFTAWIGIAAAAASTGSVVNVYDSGWVLALTTGPVTAGDVLITTTGAQGYLGFDNTPTTGADVAVALGPGPVGGGLTRVRLR